MAVGLNGAFTSRINRNIVECKVVCAAKTDNATFRINRNIVECKGESLDPDATSVYGINRNIVECKGKMHQDAGANCGWY